jgi:hypothetical protein
MRVNSADVTVAEMLREARSAAALPIVLALIFCAMSFVYIRTTKPLYEARISITARPAGEDPEAKAQSLSLSSLTALAGSRTLTNYDKLIAILISSDTASRFISSRDLMPYFFPDKWDAEHLAWRRPTGFLARFRDERNALFGLPSWQPPGVEPIISLFEGNVRITPNEQGRSHTIMFYAQDPQMATAALSSLLTTADTMLRERGQRTSDTKIAFFRKALAEEQVVEVRLALASELGKEYVNGAMLASSRAYSYDLLKDMSVSTRPVSPRPLLTLAIAIVAGITVGYALALSRRRRAGNAGAI